MLKGKHITLRSIRSADLDQYINGWADLSARGDYFPSDIFNEVFWRKRFTENGLWGEQNGHMAIVDKEDVIVGAIFFFKPQLFFSYLEIGYILFAESNRGKGYTTEALKLFTQYLFDTKPINKILLNISPDNIGSKSVAQKCGYQSEGIDRAAVFARGEYRDMQRFGLLRKELYDEK